MLYNHLHFRAVGITAIGILCGILLLLIGAATNESTVSAQNNGGIVETEGQLLNVREGPRSDYVILYQLEDQSAVEILGVDSTGDWYEIYPIDESYDTGWAFADYIRQPDEDSSSSTEPVDTDTSVDFKSLPREERAATVTARLNLAATEVAAIIATATAASEQMAIATVTAQANIAATEVAGISVTTEANAEPTPTPESAEATQPSDSDTSDSELSTDATAEAQSDLAATVVARAQIAKTEVASILSTATAEAEMQEEPTAEPTATPMPTPEPTLAEDSAESDSAESRAAAATTAERMNIYSGPGTHYTVLATVAADTIFDIVALDAKGRWYQVQSEGMAELAWVYSGLVNATGDLDALPRILETIPTRIPQVTPTQVVVADPNIPPTPTVRPLMEASDPATFEIASGQVQIVEFFGFW